MNQRINSDEIGKFCGLLFEPEDVFEVRALPKKDSGGSVQAGWFNRIHLPVLCRKLEKLGDDVEGVYVTIQHLNKDMGGRTPIGHFGPVIGNKGVTFPRLTHDTDIDEYRWAVVDVDPVRPAGQSATDEEKAHAAKLLATIIKRLTLPVVPLLPSVVVDSGNGFHAYWRITESPGVKANAMGVQCFLNLLDVNLSNELVKVDIRTFNPCRIMKLPGTLARKGEDTTERPYRMSRTMEIAELDQ